MAIREPCAPAPGYPRTPAEALPAGQPGSCTALDRTPPMARHAKGQQETDMEGGAESEEEGGGG